HLRAYSTGKQVLRDYLADETQPYIPQHCCDPTAAQDHGSPFPLPPLTIQGPQPHHTGKERQVHPPTLQREHLQRWPPGTGRWHAAQCNRQPCPYTEEAHKG